MDTERKEIERLKDSNTRLCKALRAFMSCCERFCQTGKLAEAYMLAEVALQSESDKESKS